MPTQRGPGEQGLFRVGSRYEADHNVHHRRQHRCNERTVKEIEFGAQYCSYRFVRPQVLVVHGLHRIACHHSRQNCSQTTRWCCPPPEHSQHECNHNTGHQLGRVASHVREKMFLAIWVHNQNRQQGRTTNKNSDTQPTGQDQFGFGGLGPQIAPI